MSEAIDRYLPPRQRSRRDALEAILRLELPVDRWERLEEEIVRGAVGQAPSSSTPGPSCTRRAPSIRCGGRVGSSSPSSPRNASRGVTSAEVIQEILHRFPRSPRDLIHVATCLAHGIGVIVSPDADLDRVEEIRRLAPEDRGALAPYLR